MKTKFTKWPWVATKPECSNGFWYIDEESSEDKCGALSVCYSENAEVDAHLIAAAPEMYEMLLKQSELMGFLDDQTHPNIELDVVKHEIEKLLAKARGENV